MQAASPSAIEQALAGDIEAQGHRGARRSGQPGAPKTFRRWHAEITIDNSLQVDAHDSSGGARGSTGAGLLFDSDRRRCRSLDLNIGSAHIATFGEKAADVFYVTGLNGDKIVAPAQHEVIWQTLLKIFDCSREETAPKAAAL